MNAAAWKAFGQRAREALQRVGTYACELQLRRSSGELFWVQMGGSCLQPLAPEAGIIWTFLDITDRKKSEENTREALEQQKQLNALRGRFVAMTSHEFRTPLAAILSSGEILKHYGERLPAAEKTEILDTIAASVQRMMRMLDRVLLLGKAEAQMLEFRPQTLNVAALCRELVREAARQQPGSACRIETAFESGLAPGLYDEKLLRHIFSNLLSNAIKYSPEGGKIRFMVSTERGPGAAATVFEVADEGIGIPADEIGDLFESFHRASNVGSIQGTGLGLAIVKNAVDTHGGVIEASSAAGQGTRFKVRLPQPDRDLFSDEEALGR